MFYIVCFKVDFEGPTQEKCITVEPGEVLGIMSKGSRMPIGYKWDPSGIADPLAYKKNERDPYVTEVTNFVGIPLPYRFAVFVEVDPNSPCVTSVI